MLPSAAEESSQSAATLSENPASAPAQIKVQVSCLATGIQYLFGPFAAASSASRKSLFALLFVLNQVRCSCHKSLADSAKNMYLFLDLDENLWTSGFWLTSSTVAAVTLNYNMENMGEDHICSKYYIVHTGTFPFPCLFPFLNIKCSTVIL